MGLCFLIHILASIFPGLFMLGASYAGCDKTMVVIMFTIGMGLMGPFYCGMKVNTLDLSPNYAGVLMAVVNGLGAVSGVIAPYLIGALTEDVRYYYRILFYYLILINIFILKYENSNFYFL